MTNSFKTMVAMTVIVGVALSVPVPDDSSDLSNEIFQSGVSSSNNDVSASWGGIKASASLTDDGSGSASGGAGAGVGGAFNGAANGVPSNAGTPTKPGLNRQQGFFDRIFAIPINVLQSVNTYLNQKQVTTQQEPANHNAGSTFGKDVTDNGHADSAGKPGSPMMIPITALRSVQNLLNG